MTTLWGSVTFTFTCPSADRNESPVGEWRFGSISARIVKATSSAENGVPSENKIPSRNLKLIFRPASDTFQEAASSGCSSCVWRLKRISTPPVR